MTTPSFADSDMEAESHTARSADDVGTTLDPRRLLTRLMTDRWVQPVDAAPMSPAHWNALVDQAVLDRVVPTVASAARRSIIATTTEQLEQITATSHAAAGHCLHVETVLLWLHEELDQRGIESVVLKGAAVSHLDHHVPSDRQFGDLDLLIHPADLSEVLSVLTGAGFTRRFQEFRPGFDTRYSKSVSVTGPIEIDLHRTLAHGPVGFRIPTDELWAATETFCINGRTLTALDPTTRLVHSCLHSYLDPPPPRLSNLFDIHRQLHRDDVDPGRLADRADQLGVRSEVFSALSLAIAELYYPSTLTNGWFSSPTPRPLDAALAASHRDPQTTSGARSLLSLLTMSGLSSRLRFSSWLMIPYGRTVGDVGIDRVSRFRLAVKRTRARLRERRPTT